MSPSPSNVRRESVAVPQPKRHEVAGLLVLAVALLHGLALASFHVAGGPDWVGPLGARVAEATIALLGTASVILPWSLLVTAVRLFRRTVQPLRLARTLGTAAIVVSIATALHLYLGERPALGGLCAGGLVGSTAGEGIRAVLGTAGAHTVVLTALLVALIVRTRLSLVSMAAGARQAGARGGTMARTKLVTVAAAWREARDAEGRVRALGPGARAPRIVAPEELTADALAPVLEARDEGLGFDDDARDSDPGSPVLAALAEDETPASRARAPRARRPKPELPTRTVEREEATIPVITATPEVKAEARAPRRAPAPSGVTEDSPAPRATPSPSRRGAPAGLASEETPSARAPRPARRTAPPPPVVDEDDEDDDDEDDDERASVAPPPPVKRRRPVVVEAGEDDAEEKLTIVSHAREIERAMKNAPAHVAPAAPPPAPVAMDLPPADLLNPPPASRARVDEEQLRSTAERLIKTLADYTIEGRVVEIHPGPVVTTYEVVPAAGTKLSKIARLSDDLAMSLEAPKVRIVAPIPGKGRVGFEVPNGQRQMVNFRELIETEAFRALGGALPVALGKDVVGAPYFSDLAKMPHLIIAGATGQGKSVGLNVMLASLLYKRTPEDVRLLMIDPKMVELAVYDGIPHMLLPVVTDMKKASLALRWVVDEMERRYTLFAQTGARNIVTYNERIAKALAEGRPVKGLDGPVRTKETGTTVHLAEVDGAEDRPPPPPRPQKLPYILLVVDEFADLIMVAGKEIEAAVARLAQKARAAGIHVILATQRPSVDVITGMIKANFPARVAFKVSQKVDSRTILDQQGAEHLLGMGDMLILPPGSSDLRRVHCAFVSEDEVQRVTDHWRAQGRPTYDEDILKPREDEEPEAMDGPAEVKVPQDKYERAVQLVVSTRKCSVSYVQRYLGIGYNVAARIVDKMERDGIVGAPKGPGKDREVLG